MEAKTVGFIVAMLVIAAFAIGVAYLFSNQANSARGGQVLGSLSKTQVDGGGASDRWGPCTPRCTGGGTVSYSSCSSVGEDACSGSCTCTLGGAPNETECSCGRYFEGRSFN